jgi:small subunit ribosomal protein S4
MQLGPRYKIARRLGAPIFEKTQTQKYAISAEKKSNKKRSMRPRTAYGAQMTEKQKARFFYGVTEKQFKNYVKVALSKKGVSPAVELSSILERRLDNVVWRLGLARSHRAARQMVAHGHICIGGRRTYSPSYMVSERDVITIREGSKKSKMFQAETLAESEKTEVPTWLSFDMKKMEAHVKTAPTPVNEALFDLGQVIEFYQR